MTLRKTCEIQEVELRVRPLQQLPFIYIIEVALKLLWKLRNPKMTVLGMMLSYTIMMNPSMTLLGFTHPQSLTNYTYDHQSAMSHKDTLYITCTSHCIVPVL